MLLFIILIFVLTFTLLHKEGFTQSIPLNLFQTWSTKDLPPKMKECVYRLRKQNPEFKYHLYDDEDCVRFIKENFEPEVVYAFHRLKPGAYKADLWRYCVLYVHGGMYLDIKFECCDGFKCIDLMDKEHYVMDRQKDPVTLQAYAEKGKIIVYNGCMVSPAKNPVLLKCIEKIVEHVDESHYGFNALYPTGPGLLGEVLGKNKDIDLSFTDDQQYILYKKKRILKKYKEYRLEQYNTRPGNHYHELWLEGDIYHP
jgi:mannosyltransferase OCH1-like enzyme